MDLLKFYIPGIITQIGSTGIVSYGILRLDPLCIILYDVTPSVTSSNKNIILHQWTKYDVTSANKIRCHTSEQNIMLYQWTKYDVTLVVTSANKI